MFLQDYMNRLQEKSRLTEMPRALPFRAVILFLLFFSLSFGSEVRGKVSASEGIPIRGAEVTILPLGLRATTDGSGNYIFRDVPPGFYEVAARLNKMTGESGKIEVVEGEDTVANIKLMAAFGPVVVTITAPKREMTAFEAFQSVSVMDSLELSQRSSFGLGDVIDGAAGVHKRSFGPGSSRPVVRGFDGDRVLALQNGLPTGTLSSQSGEHAEPIDSVSLDHIEVVKGPATLLYGSNAIGGVVNMVSERDQLYDSPQLGFHGQLTTLGGTNNHQAALHGNAEYGYKNWQFRGGASRQNAGDYRSPQGSVDNSKTSMTSGNFGLGWFNDRRFFNIACSLSEGRLGIPFAGEFHHHEDGGDTHVDETFTHQNFRFDAGSRLDSVFEEIKLSTNFSRWIHRELENKETATSFDNRLFNLRMTLAQRPYKMLTGILGLQLFRRDYAAQGEEALSPPTTGIGAAVFTLQEINLKSARLQLGARMDYTRYDPSPDAELLSLVNPNELRSRAFTGFSGSVGVHLPLWESAAFVANLTHSNRAPAIDELYNNGPHIGNLAFEIGDANLKNERADGIDFSLRHRASPINAEVNLYYYFIHDFVYMRLTGETEHGLNVVKHSQGDARFLGGEALFGVELYPDLWINASIDHVNAELSATGTPLPRIPPTRVKLGIDARVSGFTLKPEIVLMSSQDRVYPTETHTEGYVTANINVSYTLVGARALHLFSIHASNAGNRLYRNHLSFIKHIAPEPGRDVRFSYSLRF
jgi:iron complex outermembrane receptor protein